MLLDNIIPSDELLEFVSRYRIADFVFSNYKTIPFKAYPPRPQECLQFYPCDTEKVKYPSRKATLSGRTIITGQHTLTNNRYVGKNFLVFQVVFQPGSLYRISKIPAEKLINSYLDAEDVLGKSVRFVNENYFTQKIIQK